MLCEQDAAVAAVGSRRQPSGGHRLHRRLLRGTGPLFGVGVVLEQPGFCCLTSRVGFVPLIQEPMDVVELFGLKGVQHTPISIKNARVSQVSQIIRNDLFVV